MTGISETDRQMLAQLLVDTKSFQYSPDNPFQLASGATSPYYFDLKLLNGDPEGINAVANILYDSIKTIPEVRSVGGLAAGSISIATSISQLSWLEHQRDPANPSLTSFFVRKEQKKHGTTKRIEGVIKSPVVIIDDVITSGMSAISAVNAVKEEGLECRCLMSIIFRGSPQQRKDIEAKIPLQPIFHQDQLVEWFKELKA